MPADRSGSRPNIVFVLTDDHAAHAIGAYGSRVNRTPHLDRLAASGARLDACYCTNSICSPSRASILTGTYSHVNGVSTIYAHFDHRVRTFVDVLRSDGYRTALFGKWHLGETPEALPRDFDDWLIFPGQGDYWDPTMIGPDGERRVEGYATDLITEMSIDWMDRQPADQPFCLLVHHKAPHRSWEPHPRHADLYPVGSIPEPPTLFDDYATRSHAAAAAHMRVADHLAEFDVKEPMPAELADEEHRVERTRWMYQRYLRDYLQTVQAVDDGVGRLLDHLDERGLAENTIVVYVSDQGFFLGDHGWYDKRFMYDESLQMPFLVRWPGVIEPGTVLDQTITNVDFATTLLQACGLSAEGVSVELPANQGRSFLPLLRGESIDDWPTDVYYRYWEHDDVNHHAWAHYGVRTRTHKLIYFYNAGLGQPGAADTIFPPEWELYDLVADPHELTNVASDPAYAVIRSELETLLAQRQQDFADEPYVSASRAARDHPAS